MAGISVTPVAASRRRRLLVTGFGAFPGAPVNPTEALIARLSRDDEPHALRVLPVTWAGTQAALLDAIGTARPEAIVMFGLHGRARGVRVEIRAVNARHATALDADGLPAPAALLDPSGPAARFARCNRPALLAAIRSTGERMRLSRDAGTYLCNTALWTALAATSPDVPAVFIHVPPETRLPAARLLAVARAVLAVMER